MLLFQLGRVSGRTPLPSGILRAGRQPDTQCACWLVGTSEARAGPAPRACAAAQHRPRHPRTYVAVSTQYQQATVVQLRRPCGCYR